MQSEESIESALALHRRGSLDPAQKIYERVLKNNPKNARALHLLGTIFLHRSNHKVAISLMERAVVLDPQQIAFWADLGVAYHQNGENASAEPCCREALKIDPNHAKSLNNLGGLLLARKEYEEAQIFLRRAIRIQPKYPDPYFNLGLLYIEQKNWPAAIEIIEKGLRLNPKNAQGEFQMGAAFLELENFRQAIVHCARSVELNPSNAAAQYNLGTALVHLKKPEPALECFRKAIELKPDYAEALSAAGVCSLKLFHSEQAREFLNASLSIKPNLAIARNNLAIAEMLDGKWDEALSETQQGIAADPNYPPIHFTKGCIHLVRGEFKTGWEEYLWLRKCKQSETAKVVAPFWNGEAATGKTIVLRAEQGAGDMIQFIRYAPLILERAGAVVVECRENLRQLLQTATGITRTIPKGNSLPKDSPQVFLLNLPYLFQTELHNIPAQTPYLFPKGEIAAEAREALDRKGTLKVGLCWQGNPEHTHDRLRSLPYEFLHGLEAISGVHFFSLQKGPGSEQTAKLQERLPLTDLNPWIQNFNDSALLIQQLDLVISVDTSVAHLAGALGKPVWLLVNKMPEWRWMLDREDSPWYPSMRIFRQREKNDWKELIERVGHNLKIITNC